MPQRIIAPRGTQDVIPPQSADWWRLEERVHDLCRRFGYAEIRTPIFEATELFVRGVGSGTDIVDREMYTFADKGGRSMTLRPEWTAPVVRAALQQGLFDRGPQRLFYVGPIFRYERPQAGRLRQSHQFGVECTGFEGPEADTEVIALASELLRSYAIGDSELHLNSVGDERCRPKYREALIAHFEPHAGSLSEDARRRLKRNPLRLLDSKAPEDRRFIESAPVLSQMLCDPCREHFDAVKRYLDAIGIRYVVDPLIVRGLDYYTRTVFEFVAGRLGAQNAVCAGGRYDGLVASLGGKQIPAVGFALGIERLLLAAREGAASEAPRYGVQAVALGQPARECLVRVVAELRRTLRAPVFMDYGDRKLLAQLAIADRNGARYALIAGSAELQTGEIVLRDLEARTDRRFPLADTARALVEVGC